MRNAPFLYLRFPWRVFRMDGEGEIGRYAKLLDGSIFLYSLMEFSSPHWL